MIFASGVIRKSSKSLKAPSTPGLSQGPRESVPQHRGDTSRVLAHLEDAQTLWLALLWLIFSAYLYYDSSNRVLMNSSIIVTFKLLYNYIPSIITKQCCDSIGPLWEVIYLVGQGLRHTARARRRRRGQLKWSDGLRTPVGFRECKPHGVWLAAQLLRVVVSFSLCTTLNHFFRLCVPPATLISSLYFLSSHFLSSLFSSLPSHFLAISNPLDECYKQEIGVREEREVGVFLSCSLPILVPFIENIHISSVWWSLKRLSLLLKKQLFLAPILMHRIL